ncbi:hypothetical protein CDV36_012449, partial [Fusarium kuroshium]
MGFRGQGWASRPVGSGNGEGRIETVDSLSLALGAPTRRGGARWPKTGLRTPCWRFPSSCTLVGAASASASASLSPGRPRLWEALVDRERLAGKAGARPNVGRQVGRLDEEM